MRKYFDGLKKSEKDNIKWRSHEVTRIEAFSDAVFAFAVSLLIISLEVPKSSTELLEMMKGFIPFTPCFAGIFMIWYWQYLFFRRYGMHDYTTIMLNAILIFIVLVFVYPLKFLFSSIFLADIYVMHRKDFATLVIFYNGGAGVIYLLFILMYLNAYAKRGELHLNAIETFETCSFIFSAIASSLVAFLAAVIAFLLRNKTEHISYCFFAYGLLGVIMPIVGKRRARYRCLTI